MAESQTEKLLGLLAERMGRRCWIVNWKQQCDVLYSAEKVFQPLISEN
ncbi:MAG: hypothetical protein KAI67_04350 [Candidatus Pacebacteria bacterium]|nr:hypothetical protein [Candidatus Paceibacterota bacterium]